MLQLELVTVDFGYRWWVRLASEEDETLDSINRQLSYCRTLSYMYR